MDQSRFAVVVNNVGFAAAKMVDDPINALLVAGDHAGAEHDGIALIDAGMLVVVDRCAGKRGHGLTLGSTDQHHHIRCREVANLPRVDQQALRQGKVAEILGDFGRLHHGAADDRDLTFMRVCEFQGKTQAIDRRREAAEEQSLLGARENLVQAWAHGPFAGGIAGAVHVRGVLQQRQHAALAILRKPMQIERLPIGRGEIDLEVAGVHQHADWCFNRQGYAVDQAMRNADWLNGERPQVKLLPGNDLDQFGRIEQAVFIQLAFDIGQRELRCVHGDFKFAKDPRQPTDVVLVAVSQDDGANVLAILDEVGDIGNDDVYAEQLGLRKHETGIDDDYVVCPAKRQAVHSEFA